MPTKQEKQYLEMLLFWQTKKTMSTNAPVLAHFILISNILVFQYGWKVEFIRWGIKR